MTYFVYAPRSAFRIHKNHYSAANYADISQFSIEPFAVFFAETTQKLIRIYEILLSLSAAAAFVSHRFIGK